MYKEPRQKLLEKIYKTLKTTADMQGVSLKARYLRQSKRSRRIKSRKRRTGGGSWEEKEEEEEVEEENEYLKNN